jgi:predicted dehydrogenase
VRFGIVGCGVVGALRAQALAALKGTELVCLADPDRERRTRLASRYGCAHRSDASQLLAEPSVEAVIVCTPPDRHREHVLASLASGRPVLCEKPLAPTPEECREMVRDADARRLTLATGFNLRHFPAFARAREALASGAIGELDFVRAYHGHPGGSEFTRDSVHDARVSGGGTLMDNGIHLLDLVRFFLGDVAEVKGYRSQSVWRFPDCEDNGFALLRSTSGRIAMLQSSWTEWRGYGLWVEIYGTRGFTRASYPPMLLQLARAEAPGARPRVKRSWFPWLQVIERMRSYRWTMVQSFRAELEDFIEAVRSGRPALSSGLDGLLATEIAHAIYRSSQSGECVRVAAAG